MRPPSEEPSSMPAATLFVGYLAAILFGLVTDPGKTE
jgi:hypothetical protein